MSTQSSKSFFSLLVPVAALIATTTIVTMQTSLLSQARGRRRLKTHIYKFEEGMNTFSPPLKTKLTLNDVCKQLDSVLVDKINIGKSIATWERKDGLNPVTVKCDNVSSKTHRLTPNNAYSVELTGPKELKIIGTKTNRVNYRVKTSGFYGYGEPRSERKIMYVNEYCKRFRNVGKENQIKGIYKQTPPNNWVLHECNDATNNNFQLEYGMGYILWITPKEETPSLQTKNLQDAIDENLQTQ